MGKRASTVVFFPEGADLVAELAEAPYRFIVSKGPQASEFDLAPNMVGAEFLPQTSVLPQVDLVITHAGNRLRAASRRRRGRSSPRTWSSGRPSRRADREDRAGRL